MNKATQDQIAHVMLVAGTPEQQRQAIEYASQPVPGAMTAALERVGNESTRAIIREAFRAGYLAGGGPLDRNSEVGFKRIEAAERAATDYWGRVSVAKP